MDKIELTKEQIDLLIQCIDAVLQFQDEDHEAEVLREILKKLEVAR